MKSILLALFFFSYSLAAIEPAEKIEVHPLIESGRIQGSEIGMPNEQVKIRVKGSATALKGELLMGGKKFPAERALLMLTSPAASEPTVVLTFAEAEQKAIKELLQNRVIVPMLNGWIQRYPSGERFLVMVIDDQSGLRVLAFASLQQTLYLENGAVQEYKRPEVGAESLSKILMKVEPALEKTIVEAVESLKDATAEPFLKTSSFEDL